MVELLMVVTIIGIMALLVLPKIRIDNGAVDTAVRTIGMSVMVAQRDAVSRQHNVLVQFDTAGHVVRTIWDSNNNNTEDAGEKSRPFLFPERVLLGRPGSVPKLGGSSETAPSRLTTSRGPYFVMQRSGSVDRSDVLYFSTALSVNGGPDTDVRAMAISRATGRTVWYKWTHTGWKRG
ncbi:MAG: type II secretion system protein [Phycisphaerae bacterium]|nr:type II secretion system protein [Gemmatimonadaceae bacterium]